MDSMLSIMMAKKIEKNNIYTYISNFTLIKIIVHLVLNLEICTSIISSFSGLVMRAKFGNRCNGCKVWHCNVIKKRLQHRCFPVNFAKFLTTHFFNKFLRGLLLKVFSSYINKPSFLFSGFHLLVEEKKLRPIFFCFLSELFPQFTAHKIPFLTKIFKHILNNSLNT